MSVLLELDFPFTEFCEDRLRGSLANSESQARPRHITAPRVFGTTLARKVAACIANWTRAPDAEQTQGADLRGGLRELARHVEARQGKPVWRLQLHREAPQDLG